MNFDFRLRIVELKFDTICALMNAAKTKPSKIFLTAEWRYLVMLNYEIDPAALAQFIPVGTELDFWNGKTYVSIVGFLFRNARVWKIPIPWHRHFEEVNLRFYVRRRADDGWRRGVVFIKELVPRRAIAFIARQFYNENYVALPMSHRMEKFHGEIKSAAYFWRRNARENFLKITVRGPAQFLMDGSLAEFIAEHYWGYAKQRDGSTMEYAVEHPRWKIWETQTAEFDGDVADLYGKPFGKFLNRAPASAFLADGSGVKVYQGIKIIS
jgi:uncharacterized protein YqjF (DUF2071 family)